MKNLLIAFALAFVVTASAQEAPRTDFPEFRAWMIKLHRDWILPGYRTLDDRAEVQVRTLQTYCGEPSEKTLNDAKDAWFELIRTYRRLEAFQYGPLLKRKTSKTIDFWPTRGRTIESAAKASEDMPDEPNARDTLARFGVTAKGMPALEWLLWPNKDGVAPISRPGFCKYAVRVAREIKVEVMDVRGDWKVSQGEWGTGVADAQHARYIVLNLMIGNISLLKGRKLEKTTTVQEIITKVPNPREVVDTFDSQRSGNTKLFLQTHLMGVRDIMEGLDAVIVAESGVPSGLLPLMDKAKKSMDALPSDTSKWTLQTVRPVTSDLQAVADLLTNKIAPMWKVAADFTDADGD